nr:zinc metallochaperone AztD [Nocardioides sp. zg-DK7169]
MSSSARPDARPDPRSPQEPVEAAGPQPRLALTYDGGILVVDAEDGEVLADEPVDGFTRLSPAGDGRHLFVSGPGGFTALDLGSWTEAHGDHGHSYAGTPRLTTYTVEAEAPGHVVPHAGGVTLFDDGTGRYQTLDLEDRGDLDDRRPRLRSGAVPRAHHGLAVELDARTVLHTVGDERSRDGVRVVDASGAVLTESRDCPGIHGETFAGEVAVLGCEDGVLLVEQDRIRKVDSPDRYGRIGNQAGHERSAYVLGDYKSDPEAELERPTRVSVVDTRDASLRLVDLPASYSFRSLGRTPGGDGLVLGTDGALHVIDVRGAQVRRSVPVTQPWREPTDWQEPRPTLFVAGDRAYVTEPAGQELHVVDLGTLEVVATHALPQTPNELSGTAG